MSRKFRFEDYSYEDTMMWCRTKEEAENVCRVMEEDGRKWITGESYLDDTKWSKYRHRTAYLFNSGVFATVRTICNGQTQCLKYSDFEWEEKGGGVKTDNYNNPNHYQINGQDTMDIILSLVENNTDDIVESCYLFNIYKYVFRFGNKNGLDDLKKAQDYLERLVEYKGE